MLLTSVLLDVPPRCCGWDNWLPCSRQSSASQGEEVSVVPRAGARDRDEFLAGNMAHGGGDAPRWMDMNCPVATSVLPLAHQSLLSVLPSSSSVSSSPACLCTPLMVPPASLDVTGRILLAPFGAALVLGPPELLREGVLCAAVVTCPQSSLTVLAGAQFVCWHCPPWEHRSESQVAWSDARQHIPCAQQ